jgi:four helix bundle protein
MFLHLAHTNLDVFKYSYALTLEAYKVTKHLPDSERYNLISQIRRASLSVHLNIAEGCSRKTIADRKRFYEIARGSLIEVDTDIGIAYGLQFVQLNELTNLGDVIINTFKVLTGLITDKNNSPGA